jgi:hypothetical protein
LLPKARSSAVEHGPKASHSDGAADQAASKHQYLMMPRTTAWLQLELSE